MRDSIIKSAIAMTIARVRPAQVTPPYLVSVAPLYLSEAPAVAPGGILLRILTEGLFVGSQR